MLKIQLGLFLLIITTFVFSVLGMYVSWKKRLDIEEFILSRYSLSALGGFATLFASGMGVWILFSPAETTVLAGIPALVGYALGSATTLFIFVWLGTRLRKLMPKGHSLTEYVLHRYGKAMYALVLLTTVFYMGIALAAELTGISLAMKMVYNVPVLYTALIIGVGTVLYTSLGGFRASVFTDKIQTTIILPLLALLCGVAIYYVGNPSQAFASVAQSNPQLFGFNWSGIEYGLGLFIAIVGAELFNQVNWQRVYAAKTINSLKISFLSTGLVVIPVIILMGLFGIFALFTNTANDPSVALFTFIQTMVPPWIMGIVMILGIILIMSSMDSLLNAVVSVITVDAARLLPRLEMKKMLLIAKVFTVLFAAIMIFIATMEFSVLYLFLVADLVCVAAFFPTFFGMYNRKVNQKIAIVSTILGIAAGVIFFPTPDFSRGNLLLSFVIAFVVPTVICVLFSRSKQQFNLLELQSKEIKFRKH